MSNWGRKPLHRAPCVRRALFHALVGVVTFAVTWFLPDLLFGKVANTGEWRWFVTKDLDALCSACEMYAEETGTRNEMRFDPIMPPEWLDPYAAPLWGRKHGFSYHGSWAQSSRKGRFVATNPKVGELRLEVDGDARVFRLSEK